MKYSSLVDYIKISNHSAAMLAEKKDRITIHHVAGITTIEALGDWFSSPATTGSSNYGVGVDGRIGLYADENRRAQTSNNWRNDDRAITIEVSNDGGAPDWHVADVSLEALIALCVDICRRNEIPRLIYTGDASGNLTLHRMFANTQCPGPYLLSRIPYIAEEVNRHLAEAENPPPPVEVTSYCVQVAAYSHKPSAEAKAAKLRKAGFPDACVTMVDDVLYRVQVGTFSSREEAAACRDKVKAAGFGGVVTTQAGKLLMEPGERKPPEQIAREVTWGIWDNAEAKKLKLAAAGYDPDEVQALADKLRKG